MAASRVSRPPQRVAQMDSDPKPFASIQPVQVGDVVTLEVERLGSNGDGLCRVQNYVVTLRAGLYRLAAAAGLSSPTGFRREHAVYRDRFGRIYAADELFPYPVPPDAVPPDAVPPDAVLSDAARETR